MNIEQAHRNDHLTLSEISYRGKAFWGYDTALLEAWKADLTLTPAYIAQHCVFKLLVDGEIIGYYSLLLPPEDGTITLDNLFLLPEYIGQGYGQVVMHHSIATARAMHLSRMVLDADPNAESFYRKMGFRVYGKLTTSIANRFLPQMELAL